MPTKEPQRGAKRMPIRIRIQDLDKFAAQQGDALDDGWIFLATDTPPPVGTELDIEFCVGELGSSIRARAVVIRSVRPTGMTQGPSGMRAQITLLDDIGRMFIFQITHRLKASEAAAAGDAPPSLEPPVEDEIVEPEAEGLDLRPVEDLDLAPDRTTRSNLLFTLPPEFLSEILAEPDRYSKDIRERAENLLAQREAKKPAQS